MIVDLIPVNGGDGVIHDITGTTVYVVAVICVIPVAGLVAWVVRYVVKKKVRNSFTSSVSPELLHSLVCSRHFRNQQVHSKVNLPKKSIELMNYTWSILKKMV